MEGTLAATYFSIGPESLCSRPRASQPDTQMAAERWWKEEDAQRWLRAPSRQETQVLPPTFSGPVDRPLPHISTLKGKSTLNPSNAS